MTGKGAPPGHRWTSDTAPKGKGRPKIPEDVKEALRAASPRAVARLVELVESSDEKIALQASEAILDRAYGKPAESVAHTVDASADTVSWVPMVTQRPVDPG